ncbi:MAG: 2-oxoacid:acceptor oxidoreductase family protein, partial [Candidatus Methanofastidiosa archaeon]|nr:2-oxoacid:acceptor oxidoreductase family protein [Candidatus Methanofastidiosa archaeon]
VYTPNIVVVLDPTLLGSVDVTQGLGTDGILIVNTPKDAKEIASMLGYAGRLYTLDATKIALETIGRPVANTACAGALVKVSGLVSMDNMMAATKDKFREKLSEKAVLANIETIRKAYEEVSV